MRDTVMLSHEIRRIRLKIELPKGWFGWATVIVLTVPIMYSLLLVAAWATAGRFGIVNVEGNSMADVLPWGSQILVVPSKPRDGDFVVAWVDGCDNPETIQDSIPGLVVKRLRGGKLLSTNINSTYSRFEIRGRIVSCIPVQKIAWWLDRGNQNEYPGFTRRHEERVKNAKPISAEEQKRRQVEMEEIGEKILALEKRMGIVPGSKVP